jgi:hypothetical protein
MTYCNFVVMFTVFLIHGIYNICIYGRLVRVCRYVCMCVYVCKRARVCVRLHGNRSAEKSLFEATTFI